MAILPDELEWQLRNPRPTGAGLNAVAYGHGRFVAVGGAVLTSENGFDWTLRQESAGFRDVIFADGRFVAIGAKIAVSADGLVWSEACVPQHPALLAITWGAGRFVAVGDGGTIQTSNDGLFWSSAEPVCQETMTGVAFRHGRFAALGLRGALCTSGDGVLWSQVDTGTKKRPGYWVSLFTDQRRFIAIRLGSGSLCSEDGLAWEPWEGTTPAWVNRMMFADGVYAAAAGDFRETGGVWTARDGRVWSSGNVSTYEELHGIT